MDYLDIYYWPQWAELNAVRDNGIAECFDLMSIHGHIYYPYIRREIDTGINGEIFYDTVTPQGFNGPIIIEAIDKKRLLDEFDVRFTEHCIKNHIVAEYVRFSPWLYNHIDFEDYYTLHHKNRTFFIDLQKDFFNEEFSHNCRQNIRKAIRNDVVIEFDFEGIYIDEFCELYNLMAEKHQLDSYYLYDRSFIADTMQTMKGNIFIVRAAYQNIPISATIFVFNSKYMHAYLGGNNYKFTFLGANSLIFYEVAKWGKENGIEELHLGGAPEEGVFRFKKNFTKKGILDYFIGTRIRNEQVYNELINLRGRNNSGYFPEYRG